MPTYEYVCKSCGERLEVVQSFRDDALTTCPNCEGPLRKVFGNIGITFKGSGFYKTDNRPSGAGATSTKKESSTDGGSSSPKSEPRSEPKSEPKSSSKSDTAGSASGTRAAAS